MTYLSSSEKYSAKHLQTPQMFQACVSKYVCSCIDTQSLPLQALSSLHWQIAVAVRTFKCILTHYSEQHWPLRLMHFIITVLYVGSSHPHTTTRNSSDKHTHTHECVFSSGHKGNNNHNDKSLPARFISQRHGRLAFQSPPEAQCNVCRKHRDSVEHECFQAYDSSLWQSASSLMNIGASLCVHYRQMCTDVQFESMTPNHVICF